jgi:Family of unknown function (DUF6459)
VSTILQPQVRPVRDPRPPGHTWARPSLPVEDQPALSFDPDALLDPDALFDPGAAFDPDAPAHPGPARMSARAVRINQRRWPARQLPQLPEAGGWSAALAVAIIEVLHGRRPVAQLSRWADERVLGTLQLAVRRHRPTAHLGPDRSSGPATLHSVHVQFPTPIVAEVSAHALLGRRSIAFAFRLEASHDRWLCTVLDLGPLGLG